MADRLHGALVPADGIHAPATWIVDSLDEVTATEADVGKLARVGGALHMLSGAGDGLQWRLVLMEGDVAPPEPPEPPPQPGAQTPVNVYAYREVGGGEGASTYYGVPASGLSQLYAREDHVHAVTTDVPESLSLDSRNDEGIRESLARSDHTHDVRPALLARITPVASDATIGMTVSDATYIRCYNATPITLTIGTDATMAANHFEALPIGWSTVVAQMGAGRVTLAAAPGVTISPAGVLATARTGSWLTLLKVGEDQWDVAGDTA